MATPICFNRPKLSSMCQLSVMRPFCTLTRSVATKAMACRFSCTVPSRLSLGLSEPRVCTKRRDELGLAMAIATAFRSKAKRSAPRAFDWPRLPARQHVAARSFEHGKKAPSSMDHASSAQFVVRTTLPTDPDGQPIALGNRPKLIYSEAPRA